MSQDPVQKVTQCRGCGGRSLETVLDLGDQAACDHFPPAADLGPDPTWPLALTMCRDCTLVQLDHVSPPEEVARAVESETLRRHATEVTARINERLGLGPGVTVREFSSHHGGSWIEAFVAAGAQVVEEDADVVVDNQAIIHSEQPEADLAERVAAMGEDGILVIEFHHALRQLTGGQFDTVRHGHPLYFSLHAWSAACERHGLVVVDAWPEDVFGGCLVVVARRDGAPSASVTRILEEERSAGVTTPEGYSRLRDLSEGLRTDLVDHLRLAAVEGRAVAAYGAGSKSCTLLGAAGIGPDLLPYTADLSPAKHGRRLPGVGVPIVSPEELVDRAPDEVVILTWDIAAEVAAQLRASGLRSRLLVPLPRLEEIPPTPAVTPAARRESSTRTRRATHRPSMQTWPLGGHIRWTCRFCRGFLMSLKVRAKQTARIAIWHTYGRHLRRRQRSPRVLPVTETARRVREGASLARFGDGEFLLIRGHDIGFQAADPALTARLEGVLRSRNPRLLVCVPGVFDELRGFTPAARRVWQDIMGMNRNRWLAHMDPDREYGDALITRFYLDTVDKELGYRAAMDLRETWTGRDVVVVEGDRTRFGVGNDLLDNAASVRRIVCPARDAFAHYDDILECCTDRAPGSLFLIALGPTATVLAADLTESGFQAVDIGHMDIEYEWRTRGATYKAGIEGKSVNEASQDGAGSDAATEHPASEVIARIPTDADPI